MSDITTLLGSECIFYWQRPHVQRLAKKYRSV